MLSYYFQSCGFQQSFDTETTTEISVSYSASAMKFLNLKLPQAFNGFLKTEICVNAVKLQFQITDFHEQTQRKLSIARMENKIYLKFLLLVMVKTSLPYYQLPNYYTQLNALM